jgi:putative phosphoesterase
MKRIGLLSDTHSHLETSMLDYFDECDEIWHAGDIGNINLADQLAQIKPFRAVYGNIDDQSIRQTYPKNLVFELEAVKVFMTHIGGYPKRYNLEAKQVIEQEKPKLFICGHSHILKVMYDPKYELLHINPGAAGNTGFHLVKTMIRFSLDNGNIKDLEVVELART